jgi:hypothetical protein
MSMVPQASRLAGEPYRPSSGGSATLQRGPSLLTLAGLLFTSNIPLTAAVRVVIRFPVSTLAHSCC